MKAIKTKLTFGETIRFINEVVGNLFTKNEATGVIEYNPELFDASLKLAFAEVYCGYDDKDVDFETAYGEYGEIDIDTIITEYGIDREQYEMAKAAIYEKIEFSKEIAIQSYKQDSLAKLLDAAVAFMNTMNEKFENVNLDGISDLKEISDKVGNMSESKLIKEIVKAVTKGDKNGKNNVAGSTK